MPDRHPILSGANPELMQTDIHRGEVTREHQPVAGGRHHPCWDRPFLLRWLVERLADGNRKIILKAAACLDFRAPPPPGGYDGWRATTDSDDNYVYAIAL